MIPAIRQQYNQQFSISSYKNFLRDLHNIYPGSIGFRVAETPVFVPRALTRQLKEAGERIIDAIIHPDFKTQTQNAIPSKFAVPNEDAHTHFIALDFAICENEEQELFPQLIELQGFPTIFAFQAMLAEQYRSHFQIPASFSSYLNGYTKESYIQLLKEIIIGDHDPKEVILLEVKPERQKTKIDFLYTEAMLGIKTVCITELVREENHLFYYHEGEKTQVKRIYNRVIFDDLEHQRDSLEEFPELTEAWDVEWVPHPNWFYRISKYMLPLLDNDYVPKTYFLDKLEVIPKDLENYVLKPLFSFAGKDVILDVTREEIDHISTPENWILQRKVAYAPIIATPNVPACCEIRLFYFWSEKSERPVLLHNLCRLSKGKMIGVQYNNQDDWVGGSICFFEE